MKDYKHLLVYHPDVDLPVFDKVDVLVCGGGPAGISAAETAARLGHKTLLIERLGFLGGAQVAGYSGTICGMYYGTENPLTDPPKQAVFGFLERFVKELDRRGGITAPQPYGKTFLRPFDPQTYKEVAEDMVLCSGAKILYHVSMVAVLKDGDIFKGIVIDTKSGLTKILCERLIDSTGDADIIFRAGGQYTLGDNGMIQNPTSIFRLAGVDVPRFLEFWGKDTICPDKVTSLMRQFNRAGHMLPRHKVWVYYTTRPNELFMNVTLISGFDGRPLNVLDPEDHTEAEQVSRKQVHEYARFFRENIPGCENSFVNDFSCEVGIRQTRSIVGIEKLTDQDIAEKRKREDGIARCPWPVELHNGEVPYMFWLIDDYYEIPYGSLVPVRGENIIVAGRNLCAEHKALASCRVAAQCFSYGQAAAIATDISIRQGLPYRDIDGKQVRQKLNQDGAGLD